MHSRGSVIPLFVQQLQAGRPLTLTEPKMTRFLMTLEESVNLVEHAFLSAEPGDLFVRKQGPCMYGWVHNITNTGETELTTLFWTNSLFDPEAPDTYWEPVLQEVQS